MKVNRATVETATRHFTQTAKFWSFEGRLGSSLTEVDTSSYPFPGIDCIYFESKKDYLFLFRRYFMKLVSSSAVKI